MLGKQTSLYDSCKINFNALKQNVKVLLGDNKKVLNALQNGNWAKPVLLTKQ